MFMRIFPQGLKARLVVLVASILMVTGGISGWLTGKRHTAMLMDALCDHALSLTASIGEGCAHYLVLREYAGLETLLNASLKDNQLRLLQVIDEDGLLVGEAGSASTGSKSQPIQPARLEPQTMRAQAIRVDGDILIVWRPIVAGSPLGWLRAVYDLSAIRDAQTQTWRDTLLLSLCWVLGSAGLLLLMLGKLTAIVSEFTEFAGRLNERKGEQLPVTRGTREIVALATSLNEASSRLFASEQQRQRDQERLRMSEEKYRSLIHKVQAAIVVHAGDGHIIDSNPLAQELLGLSADQLLGRALIDPNWRFLREDETDMPVDEYPVSLVITSGQPLRNYVVGVIAPGRDRIVWVLVNGEPEFDEGGEIQMIIVSFIDITARKSAEQKLREQEEKFRDLYENAPNAYFSVDADGLIQKCNHRAGELLGLEAETLIGKPAMALYADTEQGKRRVAQVMQRFWAGETVQDEQLQMQKANGDPVWVSLTVNAVREAGGQIVESRSMVVDISQRKLAQEEIRRLNQELEQRVADRTVRLETANKELEAFAYSVSHDLRAPLRHIDGFMKLLQMKTAATLDEQGHHYIDTISKAANKMGLLIDDLLAFSRMGRLSLSFKQVELEPLVREVIRDLEPDLAGRTINWCIGDLPTVDADAAMLRLVLTNLIANAVKFTRAREQALIEIGLLHDQGTETVIFVKDNGVGFDMTYVNKLFGVFQRLHRAEEFEGTGIGLANVRRIITRHGGRVWAEGKLEQGATFYFSLPQPVKGIAINSKPV